MKPIVKVVCGIIKKDNTYFIARRKREKSLGGFWEFPGGKLEEGENPIDALRRELSEELGMKIEFPNYLDSYLHDYGEFVIELLAYQCNFYEATFEMTDHDTYAFVSPNEMMKYKFAPADINIIKALTST